MRPIVALETLMERVISSARARVARSDSSNSLSFFLAAGTFFSAASWAEVRPAKLAKPTLATEASGAGL